MNAGMGGTLMFMGEILNVTRDAGCQEVDDDDDAAEEENVEGRKEKESG